MYKNITFIVNPASGQDFPVLAVANKIFRQLHIRWYIEVTKKKGDAEKFARIARMNTVDAIVVYGGDGTVMETARALAGSSIPLLIVPGGTLNVLAKDLTIPLNPEKALMLLNEQASAIKFIDTFTCNGNPYVIRLNAGIFADAVKKTKRKNKDTLGSISYTMTVLTKVLPNQSKYELDIDGKVSLSEGVGMMINNIGNTGLQGISFRPDTSPDDGMLDIVIMKNADLISFTKMAAKAIIPDSLINFEDMRGKNITLKIDPRQTVVCDDEVIKGDTIEIEVIPKSLSFIVPKK